MFPIFKKRGVFGMLKYKRILIKISGEALADDKRGVSAQATKQVALQLKQVLDAGVQVAAVVGGGNFWRGRTSENMDRAIADQIGMLATIMNALALGDALTQLGVPNKVFTSVTVDKVANPHNVLAEREVLQQGGIVIFGGGTGSPFFSTDTAAVLRACEIHADAVFFSKAVDGIYDSDPAINPNARKFDEISFDKVLANNLKALDLTAAAMCKEFGISAVCFGKDEKDGILRILQGEKLGTVIS